jgi:hypothetical protein
VELQQAKDDAGVQAARAAQAEKAAGAASAAAELERQRRREQEQQQREQAEKVVVAAAAAAAEADAKAKADAAAAAKAKAAAAAKAEADAAAVAAAAKAKAEAVATAAAAAAAVAAAGISANGPNDIDTRSVSVRFTEGHAGCPGHTPDHGCNPAVTLNDIGGRHNIIYFRLPATIEYRFTTPVTARTISIYIGDKNGHTKDMQLRADGDTVIARFTIPQASGWHIFPLSPTTTRSLSLRALTSYPAYGNSTYLYRVRFAK